MDTEKWKIFESYKVFFENYNLIGLVALGNGFATIDENILKEEMIDRVKNG